MVVLFTLWAIERMLRGVITEIAESASPQGGWLTRLARRWADAFERLSAKEQRDYLCGLLAAATILLLMALRYTYIPSVGLLLAMIAIGNSVRRAVGPWNRRLPKVLISLGAVVAAMGLVDVTEAQVATWKNTETLFEQAAKVDPFDYIAHVNLGLTKELSGQTAAAIEEYQAAMAIHARAGFPRVYLGRILIRQGRPEAALPLLMEAVLNGAERVTAVANAEMGEAYALLGQFKRAGEHYRHAIKTRPTYCLAKIRLADLLATAPDARLRNAAEAAALAREVCGHKGHEAAEYRRVLAAAYASEGQFDQAIETAEAAEGRARAEGNSSLEARIHAALVSYRQGKPLYRQPEVGLRDVADLHDP